MRLLKTKFIWIECDSHWSNFRYQPYVYVGSSDTTLVIDYMLYFGFFKITRYTRAKNKKS